MVREADSLHTIAVVFPEVYMKTIKIVLLILVILFVSSIMGVGYVWQKIVFTEPRTPDTVVPQQGTSTVSVATTTAVVEEKHDARVPVPSVYLKAPIIISTDNLPVEQKKVLETLGIGNKKFVITPAAVHCAIGSLGEIRARELKEGAAPSLAEGLTLLACLK